MEPHLIDSRAPTSRRSLRFLFLILGVGIGSACGSQDDGAGSVALQSGLPAGGSDDFPEVLATIGDTQITMVEIRAEVGERLAQMEHTYRKERHEVVNQALVEAVRKQLFGVEAEAQGITVSQLFAEEAGANLTVTDAEVDSWYQQNQARLGGRSLEDLRGQIVELLTRTRREEALVDLERRLGDKYGLTSHLDPFRLDFENDGSPARGPDTAPITLVEFSDFECPYCARFFYTLQQVEEAYGDQVRIVYRHFPIPSLHPNAFKAAEASLCAQEQDSFWEMHDVLFTEQDRLTVRDLKEKAGRLGLDQTAFDTCLDTGRYVERVQDDQSAGRSVGITGTPALFVNGIEVEGGAVPFEAVAAVIDEELARTGS